MTREAPGQRPFAVPPDATEVLLIRHGASATAVPGEPFELLEGRSDPPLAPSGREQAALVGERLAGESLRALFATPLRRTRETAEPLAERLGVTPTVVDDLAEVGLGELEGGSLRIRAGRSDPLFARVMREERWDVIPGAEPMEAFAARVRRGLEHVVATGGPGAVAAFVHGGVIAELCRQATGSRPFAFIVVDNGSITRLVVTAGGRRLLRGFNDVAHLPRPAPDAAPGLWPA